MVRRRHRDLTGEGKLYLDSVLDVGSRRVLGFALGEHHDADLAYGALAMAVAVRGGQVPGVIIHTDQGSEYTAGLFRAACERLDVCQSMGRPGSALDNAVIESWHSTVEFELRRIEHFATRAAARAGVAAWIEDYNTSGGTRPGPDAPRSPTSGRWRERRPRDRGRPLRGPGPEGGGCAAASRRLPRSWPGDAPREGTGPPLRRQGCCASPAATALRAGLTPETTAAPQAGNSGQAPACPAPRRGASGEHRRPRTSGRRETK